MATNEAYVAVGADFSRIFEPNDFLAMINIPDEALCVLRAHLILEEFLNLWSRKLTGTEDMYNKGFVPFRTKLSKSKDLGMPDDIYVVMDKINEIRNRFSHRKGYALEGSMVDALKKKIDAIESTAQILRCEDLSVYAGGKDQHGNSMTITHSWVGADNRIRFLIVFMAFMLKFTLWIQEAFTAHGITFEIAAIPKH